MQIMYAKSYIDNVSHLLHKHNFKVLDKQSHIKPNTIWIISIVIIRTKFRSNLTTPY